MHVHVDQVDRFVTTKCDCPPHKICYPLQPVTTYLLSRCWNIQVNFFENLWDATSSWTHMQRPIDRFKYSLIQLFNYVRFNDTESREFDRDTSQHALLIISWWNRLINSSRKWKSRNVLLFCAIYRRTITLVSGLLVVNWSGNTSSRKRTSNISIQPARWRKSSRNALVTNNVRWRCQSKEVPPIINYCS